MAATKMDGNSYCGETTPSNIGYAILKKKLGYGEWLCF